MSKKPFNPLDNLTLNDVVTGLKFLRTEFEKKGIEGILDTLTGHEPKPGIKVKEIQRGDTYTADGKVVWTALADMAETSNTGWTMRVKYANRTIGFENWEYKDGDYEVPGLERKA